MNKGFYSKSYKFKFYKNTQKISVDKIILMTHNHIYWLNFLDHLILFFKDF
jgi:hypothetical protein